LFFSKTTMENVEKIFLGLIKAYFYNDIKNLLKKKHNENNLIFKTKNLLFISLIYASFLYCNTSLITAIYYYYSLSDWSKDYNEILFLSNKIIYTENQVKFYHNTINYKDIDKEKFYFIIGNYNNVTFNKHLSYHLKYDEYDEELYEYETTNYFNLLNKMTIFDIDVYKNFYIYSRICFLKKEKEKKKENDYILNNNKQLMKYKQKNIK